MSSPNVKSPKVARTRNAGTFTEADYFQAIRSALRDAFRYWKPAQIALQNARFRYMLPSGKTIWAFRCADCGRGFRREGVHIDHVEPVGALRDLAHLADFVRRLTPEDPAAYKIRCVKVCHAAKSGEERAARANAQAGQTALLLSGPQSDL